jgi:parallel beta-helix repeat protein
MSKPTGKMASRWLAGAIFGVLLVASGGRPAAALSCGDTIGPGGAVTLTEDLIGPCDTNPVLRVIGPVVLDLNGHTVSCGGRILDSNSANYTGLVVEGQDAYVKNGSIADCGAGLLLIGGEPTPTAHTILEVTVRDNFRQGINVGSHGNRLIGNTAVRNSVGIRFNGDNNVLMRTAALNNAIGIEIADSLGNNVLVANTATHNDVGFSVAGSKNTLIGNKAAKNRAEGFRVNSGIGNVIMDNIAKKNAGDGLSITSRGNVVKGNHVQHNGGHGIALYCFSGRPCAWSGGSHTVTSNTARGHAAPRFDLVDNFPACDHNSWEHNDFGTRSQGCIR